jgi:hypothetical protein
MTDLTPTQRKQIAEKVRDAEELQRLAMSRCAWDEVWHLQGAIVMLCTLLDRDPWIQTPTNPV